MQPFEDFVRVDEGSDGQRCQTPSDEAINQTWKDLEIQLEQMTVWQDERDAIEGEAASFEVGDMEGLRTLAKGELQEMQFDVPRP